MRQLNSAVLLVLLACPVLPAAAQQPDNAPAAGQSQSPSQITPVQPERTPQQSDQVRRQGTDRDEGPRLNQNWTTRRNAEERVDADRMPQRRMIERDDDRRTVGRAWRDDDERDRGYRDDDRDGGQRYGGMDRDAPRYFRERPRGRVKTCIEYPNGDEYCRYRD